MMTNTQHVDLIISEETLLCPYDHSRPVRGLVQCRVKREKFHCDNDNPHTRLHILR